MIENECKDVTSCLKIRVVVILVVFGTLKVVRKGLYKKNWSIGNRRKNIQTTALLRSNRRLRKVLETRRDLLPLRFYSKSTSKYCWRMLIVGLAMLVVVGRERWWYVSYATVSTTHLYLSDVPKRMSVVQGLFKYAYKCSSFFLNRVFSNELGDWGPILGPIIPKTQKMVLDTALPNTQHYNVRIKGKVSCALPYTSVK